MFILDNVFNLSLMKKYFLFLLAISIIRPNTVNAQVGGLLKKASKSVSNELLGKPAADAKNVKTEPEPSCACDQPEQVFDLGGKLQLVYSEINISMNDDGTLLVQDRAGSNYYLAKDGTTHGPYKQDDPQIATYLPMDADNNNADNIILKNKPYISKSGEKYLITFGGKNYGPFGLIQDFVVSKSKDKFAAMVIKTVVATEDEGKKMDEAIKNAKTQQEKMDLAMKYSQQMQEKVQNGGGPMSTIPSLVTNIPGIQFDYLKSQGGTLNGNIKYDDILVTTYDKIFDLNGKVLFNLGSDATGVKDLFVNTDNTKYAAYKYGTLTFSDKTTMSDLFNPHLVKANGQVYLAYMYYSPKRNAIMQCKIPF